MPQQTLGYLVAEARQMLNDEIPISGTSRFTDAHLMAAANDGIWQVRQKRPDLFLAYGLRTDIPTYALPGDANTVIPFSEQYYPALLFYVVGRSEVTEDTFADNGRAVTLMNKFTSQLLRDAS
jgi:hypothetical protein